MSVCVEKRKNEKRDAEVPPGEEGGKRIEEKVKVKIQREREREREVIPQQQQQ